MKLRKNWKRFWTLDRHHAEGFTLVELIVVIAILAILGGVAVPAYSGYVTKANKQADLSLISEIEHALTLAGYNGTFTDGEGGYVILSTEGVSGVEAGSNLEKALIDTFGTGYADNLKLSYSNWSNNGMLDSLLNADDPIAAAKNVLTSSYITGNSVEQLLSEVEDLTGVASGVIGNVFGDAAYTKTENFFQNGSSNAFTDAVEEVYGEDYDTSKLTETELANLMVLASAKEFSNGAVGSQGGMVVADYALLVGFVSTEQGRNDPTVSAAYQDLQDALDNPEVAEGGSYYQYVMEKIADCKSAIGQSAVKDDYTAWMSGEGAMNTGNAFISIMDAVDNANITQDDMGSPTVFTEGKGYELFNNYLDSAEMISNMDAEGISALKNVGDGTVVVGYVQKNSTTNVVDTLAAE